MTPPAALRMRRAFRWAPRLVDTFGEQALFYGQSLMAIPLAVRLHHRETARLIAEMAFGAGGLLVIGGTLGVTALLTLASGGILAVQGYSSLGDIGIEALTGFLSALVPLYSLATLASFFAARFTMVYLSGQSSGLYDHYFTTFLIPTDLPWSFPQAIAMSIAVMLVHTYYGYNAKGGPVGVGVATGDAVRTSLVVVVITLLTSLAVYGSSGKFTLSG